LKTFLITGIPIFSILHSVTNIHRMPLDKKILCIIMYLKLFVYNRGGLRTPFSTEKWIKNLEMRSKLGEKLEVGQKRDEYRKDFTYLSGSLTKQKRPLHKEREERG